jgi:hypothetical protein
VPIAFNTSINVHHPRVKDFVAGLIAKPKCTTVWLAS